MRKYLLGLAVCLLLIAPRAVAQDAASAASGSGMFGIGLAVGIHGNVNYTGIKYTLTTKDGSVSDRITYTPGDTDPYTNRAGEVGISLLYGIPSTIFQVGLEGYYNWGDGLYVDEIKTNEAKDWAHPIYKWEHQDWFGVMAKLRTFAWSNGRLGFFVDLDVPCEWSKKPLERDEKLFTQTSREFTTGFSIVPGVSYSFNDMIKVYGRLDFISFDYRYTTKTVGFYYDAAAEAVAKDPVTVDRMETHSAKFQFQTMKDIAGLMAVDLGLQIVF